MLWRLNAVLGLIKAPCSITMFSTKRPVKTCFVELKSQIKDQNPSLKQYKTLAVPTNMQNQLVTVIAHNGQRDKHSGTFWTLQLMKPCGTIALLKLGKLQPRTDTLTSSNSSTTKITKTSTNVEDLELKQSAILTQCALGRRRPKPTIRVEEECTVAIWKISSPPKKRKDSPRKLRKLRDKKKWRGKEKKERLKEMLKEPGEKRKRD